MATALLVVHVAIVLDTERVMGRPEFFPFASFSLFSRVPNVVDDHGIRVRSIGGKPQPDETWFERSPALFFHPYDHDANVAIHRLGDLVARVGPDHPDAVRMRRWLEQNWLRRRVGGDMVYDLVARRYDPLARWRDGSMIASRRVATFSTTRASTATTKAAS